jgi:polyhydroxyalkanoate synthesis regulator phasin
MPDAWRAYLEMALGLAEVPRKKAQQVAGDLVAKSGVTAAQLQGLVEDALAAGMANREALTKIVRFEVDRALGAVGLATADEVDELTERVRDLERQLRQAQDRVAVAESPVPDPEAGSVRHATRSDTPAPMPQPVPAATAASGRDVAQEAVPQKAVAKKVAKKAVAKKAVAKKAVAKKAAASDGGAAPANASTRKATTPSAKQGNARGAARSGDKPAASPAGATPSVPPTPAPPTFETPDDGEPTP